MDHFFLKFRDLAELAAGGHDQFEFVGRVDGASTTCRLGPKETQHHASGAAHKEQDRTRQGEERLHGRGDRKGNLLGALQGQSFRDQLAEDYVHVGDQAEGDGDRDGVGVDRGVRNSVNETHPFDQAGDHGLADPAEGEADHGDPKLDAVHHFVEVLVKALHDARADASRGNELLDAGIAHAHQGEFRCCEEGIGRHQEQDQKDPEQHKGDHGWVILTFQTVLDCGWRVLHVGTEALGCPSGRRPDGVLRTGRLSQNQSSCARPDSRGRLSSHGCPHMVCNARTGVRGVTKFDSGMRYPFRWSLV